LFTSGFLILAHQAVIYGEWFSLDRFLHHENLAAVLFAFVSGIFLSLKTKK